MVIERARVVELRTISDPKGDLTPIEGGADVPFDIHRVYYTYHVPEGGTRGGHAHWVCREVIVAVSGSFEVVLDDGSTRSTYRLERPDRGLYVPSMIWRELEAFSVGAVCLVLASDHYDQADYIRDHGGFLEAVRSRR